MLKSGSQSQHHTYNAICIRCEKEEETMELIIACPLIRKEAEIVHR